MRFCEVCGKAISNSDSLKHGMGPVCWKRHKAWRTEMAREPPENRGLLLPERPGQLHHGLQPAVGGPVEPLLQVHLRLLRPHGRVGFLFGVRKPNFAPPRGCCLFLIKVIA